VKKLPLVPDRLPFWLDLINWIWFATLAHEVLDRINRMLRMLRVGIQSPKVTQLIV
jgi:hypothetical protein